MKITLLITALFVLLSSSWVNAEIAVVVHPSNSNTMDKAALAKIFLGKSKKFPDGSSAVPINQSESTPATAEFNDKVLGKSSSQLKAYWSKLVFTGKGAPPKEVGNDSEVLELVAANPNIIGFVDASAVNDTVKVVAKY